MNENVAVATSLSDESESPKTVDRREPHFVTEYRRYAKSLMDALPHDKAMEEGVGGHYEVTGRAELGILIGAGLSAGHSVFDLGCGTGRLAWAISERFGDAVSFQGTDVVPEFLEFAKAKAAASWKFTLHSELSIPEPDASMDYVTAFSVFTHLFYEECFIYLRDMRRVLKPKGSIIFSFLEADLHWPTFEHSFSNWHDNQAGVTITFIERPTIQKWASVLGLRVAQYQFGAPLGQSVVILKSA